MAPTRVVLVEDHDMVAEAMTLALQRVDDIEIVARARSIETALAEVDTHAPDVVLLDRRLPAILAGAHSRRPPEAGSCF